jgi:hypothetical protein
MSSSYLESSHSNIFSDSIDGLKQHTNRSASHHPDDTVIQTGKSGSQKSSIFELRSRGYADNVKLIDRRLGSHSSPVRLFM